LREAKVELGPERGAESAPVISRADVALPTAALSVLGTLENPKPRYKLECYPVVFVLGAAWISGWKKTQVHNATVIR